MFKDRTEAGQELAKALSDYAGRDDVVVLGLPRGGMPVAREVADALDAPLDTFVVRKLGVPGHEELAMGAVASGGVRVMNRHTVKELNISEDAVERVAQREQQELRDRESRYREGAEPVDVSGRTVLLVDDGLATGASMRAAVQAVRERGPAGVVVAVPVAPPETCHDMRKEADACICVETPESFGGVGGWYEDFAQVTDDEVRDILSEARSAR
jgi:predicted phosphoribosyltransferase